MQYTHIISMVAYHSNLFNLQIVSKLLQLPKKLTLLVKIAK